MLAGTLDAWGVRKDVLFERGEHSLWLQAELLGFLAHRYNAKGCSLRTKISAVYFFERDG